MRPSSPERHYPAQPLAAASIAVFRGQKVLLARRTRAPGAGLFALPGGLVELGETLAEAALRELAEETGVQARLTAFNSHNEIIERDGAGQVQRHYIIASFVGAWVAGDGQCGPEAGEIVWANRETAMRLDLAGGLAPVLALAFDLAEAMA